MATSLFKGAGKNAKPLCEPNVFLDTPLSFGTPSPPCVTLSETKKLALIEDEPEHFRAYTPRSHQPLLFRYTRVLTTTQR